MSWDLEDVVPLSITIADADGVLADAGSVSLTITTPDGVDTVFGPIASTTTGVYDHNYATVQAGRHVVRWVASGANASAYTDTFDVQPVDGGAFISLRDTKNFLRKLTDEDDEDLRGFIAAACQAIEDRMGHVAPVTVTADRTPRRGVIVLPERPVISVTSVVKLPGGAAIPAADEMAGTDGWKLENAEGVLSVPTSSSRVRVTYRAGRSPLPQNFRLAGLDLVRHLWQGSQHNGAGGRPTLGDSDAIAASVRAYAMPYRVMELLGLKKTQERDEIFVG
jgi:uncharacterized phiE125 gp8 family phage protein